MASWLARSKVRNILTKSAVERKAVLWDDAMMNLSSAYQWLEREPGPKVLLEMKKIHGVREMPGSADNPAILAWADELGDKVGIDYQHDSEAWCGITAGIVAQRAGYEPPNICVRASSWDGFGNPVSGAPMLGDFLRFQRPGGGHIGLYVGEDKDAFHVWGGNQADSVSIARISRARLVTARRCPWKTGQPSNVRRVFLSPSGAISGNEA